MRRRQAGATPEQTFAQRAVGIGCAIAAPALQLRHDELDHVLHGLGSHGEGEVEAVDVARLGERLQLVGDSATCSAASRTVQRREGSARVMFSRALRPESFSTCATTASRSSVEKSTPVQPDSSASAPSTSAYSRYSASFARAASALGPVTMVASA